MNYIINKSPVFLALKIIVIEILIELIYLLTAGGLQIFAQQFGYETKLISPVTQLILLPIQISVIIIMLVKWSSETYEVQKDELKIRYGILKRIEKAYPYRNMQSVIVRQSFIGRILGVGTVSVFVPTLGNDLVFSEVSNPSQFAETIKNAIPDPGNSQFLLRR